MELQEFVATLENLAVQAEQAFADASTSEAFEAARSSIFVSIAPARFSDPTYSVIAAYRLPWLPRSTMGKRSVTSGCTSFSE